MDTARRFIFVVLCVVAGVVAISVVPGRAAAPSFQVYGGSAAEVPRLRRDASRLSLRLRVRGVAQCRIELIRKSWKCWQRRVV